MGGGRGGGGAIHCTLTFVKVSDIGDSSLHFEAVNCPSPSKYCLEF